MIYYKQRFQTNHHSYTFQSNTQKYTLNEYAYEAIPLFSLSTSFLYLPIFFTRSHQLPLIFSMDITMVQIRSQIRISLVLKNTQEYWHCIFRSSLFSPLCIFSSNMQYQAPENPIPKKISLHRNMSVKDYCIMAGMTLVALPLGFYFGRQLLQS